MLQSRVEKQAFQAYEIMCEEMWRIINVAIPRRKAGISRGQQW